MKSCSVVIGLILLVVAFTIHDSGLPISGLLLSVIGLAMTTVPFVVAYRHHS